MTLTCKILTPTHLFLLRKQINKIKGIVAVYGVVDESIGILSFLPPSVRLNTGL